MSYCPCRVCNPKNWTADRDTVRQLAGPLTGITLLPRRCGCGRSLVTSQGDRAHCGDCGGSLCEACCDARKGRP